MPKTKTTKDPLEMAKEKVTKEKTSTSMVKTSISKVKTSISKVKVTSKVKVAVKVPAERAMRVKTGKPLKATKMTGPKLGMRTGKVKKVKVAVKVPAERATSVVTKVTTTTGPKPLKKSGKARKVTGKTSLVVKVRVKALLLKVVRKVKVRAPEVPLPKRPSSFLLGTPREAPGPCP